MSIQSKGKSTSDTTSDNWAYKDGQRIVLFDLDSTLIDSDTARKEAGARALRQLEEHLPDLSSEDGLDAAYQAIYQCHSLITGRVGPKGHVFEDMRQKWNTRSSYALLIAWRQSSFFPKYSTSYVEELQTILQDNPDQLLRPAEEILSGSKIEYFKALNGAVRAFWEGNWDHILYKGVPDILKALRDREIKYYVATEGDLETQWSKICVVKLDELVTPSQLLATSQAAKPEEDLSPLNQILEWYRGRAAACRDATKLLAGRSATKASASELSSLNIAAVAAERVIEGLEFIVLLFEKLGKKLYEHGSDADKQVRPEFYNRVLYAINQSPIDPRTNLNRFDMKWNQTRPLRVVMVGDNPANDIMPIIELGKNLLRKKILPIWVKQGKYGEEKNRPKDISGKNISGFLEKDKIEEVGELLKELKTWRDYTEKLDRPTPLFASALMSKKPNIRYRNVKNYLTGIAAIKSGFESDPGNAPRQEVVERASKFVDTLHENIISDVANDPKAQDVLEDAFVLCTVISDTAIEKEWPRLLPLTAIDFILSVAERIPTRTQDNSNSNVSHKKFAESFLAKIADKFLTLSDGEQKYSDWAGSIIKFLAQEKHDNVVRRICTDIDLHPLYLDRLHKIVNTKDIPHDFPREEATFLYGVLQIKFDLNGSLPEQAVVLTQEGVPDDGDQGSPSHGKQLSEYAVVPT